ncbi:MYND-like zinc finger, mRNA-binding [Phytophthora cactorum]|nr:MYND-like zinc finger, mRNA-binding [Phytophthora cactorum]
MTGAAPCVTPTCGKSGSLICPTCKKLGIPPAMSTFCSQECFKSYWSSHKALHKMFTRAMAAEQARSPFDGYEFTGKLRPGKVSETVKVPETVNHPDYAETGIPESEQLARRESNIIPVYTPEQIKGIREACRLGREVLDIAGKALRPGVTGDEIDKIVHQACIERGCYPSPLNYYHFPNGDIVNLDVTVYKNGYHGDLNETFLVGNVDEEGVHLVKTTFESLAAAAKIIRPGTMFRELGKHISAVANAEGFSVVKSYCGHGVGTHMHGIPDIPHYAKNKAVGIMKPGMIFTIEPMINLGTWRDQTWPDEWTSVTRDGLRSAQFEHTFLVTETGYEILTARENEPVMEWSQAKLQRLL